MDEVEDRLLKRFTILKKMEYFISESIYYRSNSDVIYPNRRQFLWKTDLQSARIALYEDTNRGK